MGVSLVSLIGFSLVALFSAILHGISPLLFAWEVRNVLRFFAFLVACVGLLDIDDIGRIMRLLSIVFVINIFYAPMNRWSSIMARTIQTVYLVRDPVATHRLMSCF